MGRIQEFLVKKAICRTVSIVQFAKFVHKLGILLHMDARVLAETMLQIAEDADSRTSSLDDSAIAFSMDTVDGTAQVRTRIQCSNASSH